MTSFFVSYQKMKVLFPNLIMRNERKGEEIKNEQELALALAQPNSHNCLVHHITSRNLSIGNWLRTSNT